MNCISTAHSQALLLEICWRVERAKILTRSLVSMDSVDDINISGPNRCSLTADDMVLFTSLKEQVMHCKKVRYEECQNYPALPYQGNWLLSWLIQSQALNKNTMLTFQLGVKLSNYTHKVRFKFYLFQINQPGFDRDVFASILKRITKETKLLENVFTMQRHLLYASKKWRYTSFLSKIVHKFASTLDKSSSTMAF